jgi:Immunity protein Imm5
LLKNLENSKMLPKKILVAIEHAYDTMFNERVHNLLPKERLAIYDALGYNHRVIGWLCIKTAQHVLSIWDTIIPDDDTPHSMILLAESVLRGRISVKEAKTQDDNFYYHIIGGVLLDNDQETPYIAKHVCNACYDALKISFGARPFQKISRDIINQNTLDEFIAPDLGDTASSAVTAYAGTTVIASQSFGNPPIRNVIVPIPDFNPQKRLEFWTWWLKEAIPQAWELAHSS